MAGAVVLGLSPLSLGALKTQDVPYTQDGVEMLGYLAYDDTFHGKRPGVLIVHEWFGIGPYSKRRAEQLAGLGYIAFAADIYGKEVRPKTRAQAAEQAGKYKADRALLRQRTVAALDVLRKTPRVDPARLAAVGYCFGGMAVLELARSGADLAGVVSFHGGLSTPTPEDARNIKAKVLALHGADDPNVPPAEVAAFEEEMRKAGVDWQLNLYGGAVHAFTNPDSGNDPSKGVAYQEKADKRSWGAMNLFFSEIFRQPPGRSNAPEAK